MNRVVEGFLGNILRRRSERIASDFSHFELGECVFLGNLGYVHPGLSAEGLEISRPGLNINYIDYLLIKNLSPKYLRKGFEDFYLNQEDDLQTYEQRIGSARKDLKRFYRTFVPKKPKNIL